MSRSSFLSIISVLVCANGCSDPDCGPHGAPADLAISGANVSLSYGGLSGSPNNDCPDPGAPKGVVSLTICGELTTAPGGCTGAGGGVFPHGNSTMLTGSARNAVNAASSCVRYPSVF